MKMISFCNKKGGVGKTTLCKNVAYKLSLDGAKVLLIDLDPQATLSVQFATKDIFQNKSLSKIINAIDMLPIKSLIQKTKYKNIDIIVGNEELNKSSTLINTIYQEKDRDLIADIIYQSNQKTFDGYDYVLIDYPPTVQELGLSFLTLSDLIIIPINSGIGSYKGIIDLKNTLNVICRKNNRNIPKINIILNNIKDNENTATVLEWLKNDSIYEFLSENIIKHSDTFIKTENKLNSIWDNNVYWRQKQAYEELIKEIK
ncbi:ParA family protein [Spiroplasma phoeniceum]|uniref:Chromosome partitioning protein ParA n=1 Tax=Spiroplasma phoeniceum P40 TaxID=1276259 RepID=A0A345DSU2_9MOLU|nr:ParA family protein [Spiroplasma phoeniceum]AXF97283.1 chromosome partitioning protein ParA [Spiroplasma phoeniceum P40]